MAKKSAASTAKSKPLPVCKAILLCQHAIIDALSNTPSLIGIFNGLFVSKFPGETSQCTIFVQLEDGMGQYEMTVEVHDLRDDFIIARTVGQTIDFPKKRVRMNLFIPVPRLPIKHAGNYDLVVFADRQEIDRQQFRANRFPDERRLGNALRFAQYHHLTQNDIDLPTSI